MRRQFALPEFDVKYLDTTGIDWETIVEPRDSRWLLLSSWPVPAGYTAEQVTVALLIPAGYPDSQIDMAYFDPHLARQDGKAIGALATHNLDGRTFQ